MVCCIRRQIAPAPPEDNVLEAAEPALRGREEAIKMATLPKGVDQSQFLETGGKQTLMQRFPSAEVAGVTAQAGIWSEILSVELERVEPLEFVEPHRRSRGIAFPRKVDLRIISRAPYADRDVLEGLAVRSEEPATPKRDLSRGGGLPKNRELLEFYTGLDDWINVVSFGKSMEIY
jgi:hypothetical protein